MIFEKFLPTALWEKGHTLAWELLASVTYPWEALAMIKETVIRTGRSLPKDEYEEIAENVWAAKDASVAASAHISAPTIIGHGTEIRHCAFIRGSALIGNECVVGNSTELKNAILFDRVQVPHFNYVGDSILGFRSHMGAGAITSNVKSDKSHVTLREDGELLDTGLKKFGAMLGDGVEVGCNSVLNPGTVIGRNASVYPLSFVRGYVPSDSIYKRLGEVCEKR